MEVNWLEDFLTLSVTRNFSRAAELRNVTQPAFSRRIRNLEYWVGAVLIDRSIFPTSLTPAGEAFRKTAQETLETLRNGREEAQGLMPKSGEVVTIAASHTIAVSFFAEWHAGLQANSGTIKARVVADNVAGCIEALITGHCGLMLAYSSAALPTLAQMSRYPSLPLAGAGIAWIPELAVRDELVSGSLVCAGEDRHTTPLEISLHRQAEISRPEVEAIWSACVGAVAR